ncbi:MAG: CDGSH iron-sulfur domain-containing protein [Panacagrimonas sp.]
MSQPTEKPVVASRTPFPLDVEAGKAYWWCACGLSKSQPLCDGSHKPTAFVPTKFVAEQTGKVWFCGCKQTGKPVMCDGTHNKLA